MSDSESLQQSDAQKEEVSQSEEIQEEEEDDSEIVIDEEESEAPIEEIIPPKDPAIIKEEVNSICLNIFLNFSKFYLEERDFLLPSLSLVKLLREINIVENTKKETKKNGSFPLKPYELDIILKTISPKKTSKFNSTQFLNLIILLAHKYNPKKFKENTKESIYSFVKQHFLPVTICINEGTSTNWGTFAYRNIEHSINELNKTPLNSNTLCMINSLYKGLAYIYKLYYSFEVNSKLTKDWERLIKESLVATISFAKNYELSPAWISTEKVAIYFNCWIDKQENEIFDTEINLGTIFTLNKFCLFLINIANNLYAQESEHLWERVLLLIKRLEISNGRKNTESKFNIMYIESAIWNIDPDMVSTMRNSDKEKQSRDKGDNGKEQQDEKKNSSHKKKRDEDDSNEDDDDEDEDEIVDEEKEKEKEKEKHFEAEKIPLEQLNKQNWYALKSWYETYSICGDKLSSSHMTYNGYLKLLKDFDLLEQHTNLQNTIQPHSAVYVKTQITERKSIQTEVTKNKQHQQVSLRNTNDPQYKYLKEKDADLLFFKVLGQPNNSKRLTYHLFLQIMNSIALTLHPEMKQEEAFNALIREDMQVYLRTKNMDSTPNQIMQIMNKIKDTDAKNIWYEFESVMQQIYDVYASHHFILPFTNFFNLYKDFGLFPDVINLLDIKKLFTTLCRLNKVQQQNSENIEEYITKVCNEESEKDPWSDWYDRERDEDEGINFEFFLWSWGVLSWFVKGKEEANECEKQRYIFKKMSMSKGSSNPRKLSKNGKLCTCHKQLVEVISYVNEKYGKYFEERDEIKDILHSENMFQTIFAD